MKRRLDLALALGTLRQHDRRVRFLVDERRPEQHTVCQVERHAALAGRDAARRNIDAWWPEIERGDEIRGAQLMKTINREAGADPMPTTIETSAVVTGVAREPSRSSNCATTARSWLPPPGPPPPCPGVVISNSARHPSVTQTPRAFTHTIAPYVESFQAGAGVDTLSLDIAGIDAEPKVRRAAARTGGITSKAERAPTNTINETTLRRRIR